MFPLYHRKSTGASSHTGYRSNRQSRILRKFSLSRRSTARGRRGDGDRVRLVESEGGEGGEDGGLGERDVMSDAEIENVKVREQGEE